MEVQGSLFQRVVADFPSYTPPELPDLRDVKELVLDTETTGLRWWGDHRPIGLCVSTRDGKTWYIPWGHAGGNLDPDRVRNWCRDNLRDKHLTFFNAVFDVNMMRAWGVNLEEQNNTVGDVALYAALLDDHRYQSSLDVLAQEELGESKIHDLDKSRMAEYHAAEVADYGQRDVYLTNKLLDAYWRRMDDEDLHRVRALEDECIYATAEMEWNGAPIDEEKLNLWLVQSQNDYVKCLLDLRDLCGVTVNPKSMPDLKFIFNKFEIAIPTNDMPGADFGKDTFKKEYLAKIDHPVVRVLRRAKRLASVRSKYLLPFKADVSRNGVVRYALHQLRADKEGEEAGTISGRYSSSAHQKTGDGVNIQNIAGKKLQHSVKEETDWHYNVRELFIPESGLFLAGDADQIEYRWFAHLAQPPRVMEAYKKDPKTNFHREVHAMISQYREITYELTKDCNFAGLFGAGPDKFAFMLGMTTEAARPLYNTYHKSLPEARRIYRQAIALAQERGFVRTHLGRRARFPDSKFCSPALNRVIQGSAADENKTKLVLLRKTIKALKLAFKLRFTVHDEVCGDVADADTARAVSEVLNTQILKTRVPLLWTVNVGPNWQQCKKVA